MSSPPNAFDSPKSPREHTDVFEAFVGRLLTKYYNQLKAREQEIQNEKEQQRNKLRFPFALGYFVIAVLWLVFTGYVIFEGGRDDPLTSVDYRIILAMLGIGLGALYAPLRIFAKFLFN